MKTEPVADTRPNGVLRPVDSLRDLNNTIEEARKLQRQADDLLPQLVRMILGRLHLINPRGFHSSHHDLLMNLKKELSNYNGQSARWEKK